MNRKPAANKWSEVIQVLVSKEMKASIVRLAEEDGKSQSSMTRELLKYAIEREVVRRGQRRWKLKKMAEKALGDERPEEKDDGLDRELKAILAAA